MATSKPLDEQIVLILTKSCTADEAAKVRGLAEEAFATLNAEADAADVASLSPLASDKQAMDLRGQANDLRFRADRLDARVAALSTRVQELREAEARAVETAERNAAIAERDALAADIADQYPRIVGQLTRLTKRIRESDARCAKVSQSIESAEARARKVPGNFYSGGAPVMRIGEMNVPMPDGSPRLGWNDNPFTGVSTYPGLDLGLDEAA